MTKMPIALVLAMLMACDSQAAPAEVVEPIKPPPVAEESVAEPIAEVVVPEPVDIHAPFDAILKATVRSERVDYAAIKGTHRADLSTYLDVLAATNAAALPRRERLALYINVYNATMVATIADRYRSGYSVAEGDFGVFKEPLVRLSTGTISLNDLENKVIRPMGEARIHAALVCGAQSCPPLISKAYTAANLNSTLERNMRRWINDPGRNTIDTEGQTLGLSAIFDWYADDFGGKEALAAYVDRYTEAEVAEYPVSFVEYSWALNGR